VSAEGRAWRRRWRTPLRAGPALLPVLVAGALVAGLLTAPVTPAARPDLGAGTAWFRLGRSAVLADGATARVIGRTGLPEDIHSARAWPTRWGAVLVEPMGGTVAEGPTPGSIVTVHGTAGEWRATSLSGGPRTGSTTVVRPSATGAWIVSPATAEARYIDGRGPVPAFAGSVVRLPRGTRADQVVAADDGRLWVAGPDGLHRYEVCCPRAAVTPAAVDGRPRLALVRDRPVIVDDAGVRPFSAAGEAGSRAGGPVPADVTVLGTDDALVTVEPGGRVQWIDPAGGVLGRAHLDVRAGEEHGEPIVLGGRVFLPVWPVDPPHVRVAAHVVVVDRAAPGVSARRLGPLPTGPVRLFAHEGHVWWVETGWSSPAPVGQAGVITADLSLRPLSGLGPDDVGAPTAAEPPYPDPAGSAPQRGGGRMPAPPDAPVCARNAPAAMCPPMAGADPDPGGPSTVDRDVPCPVNASRSACAPNGGRDGAGEPGPSAVTIGWSPPNPRVGEDVRFWAEAGPGARGWRWSFPGADRTERVDAEPVVRWREPGDVLVTVEVATPAGTARGTRTVPVAAPDDVVVPAVLDRPEAEARARLAEAGFIVGPTVLRPAVPDRGTVLEVRSAAGPVRTGARLPRGTTVSLVVSDHRGAVALGGGDFQTCAVLADGAVRCWGGNDSGQVGDRTMEDRFRPVTVAGISDALAVTGGSQHTCALVAGGRVRCWGDDRWGELGDGPGTIGTGPVDVADLRDAMAISAGGQQTCALVTGGDVWCWGTNLFGLTGEGSPQTSDVPVPVPVHGARFLGTGGTEACAVVERGAVVCWGAGHGPGAVPVPGIAGATQVRVGADFICALLGSGAVSCWDSGMRGGSSPGYPPGAPLPGTGGIVALGELAASEPCGLLAGGRLRCWTWTTTWDGGIPTFAGHPGPVRQLVPAGATAATSGNVHGCALVDVDVLCWGSNVKGGLGNGGPPGQRVDSPVPVALHDPLR
jgi:hypothetical protein